MVSEAITVGNTADYGEMKVKISYDNGVTLSTIFNLAEYYSYLGLSLTD